MRVLFLIDNLRPGGAQKALLSLARAVRARGGQALIWRLGGSSEFESECARAEVPVLGGLDKPWPVLQPISLYRMLRRERVDVVQTMLFNSDIVGRVVGRIARRFGDRRRPVVVSSTRASNLRNAWWKFRLQRVTAPMADAFVAVSQRTLEYAAEHEGLARERATVIPNGIDAAEWRSLPDRGQARAVLGVERDVFLVGAVGRFHEQKGHEYLLRAAAALRDRAPNVRFLLVGYGPARERLLGMVRDLDLASRVTLMDYRSDVKTVMAALDVFALPSLWEGMSNAVLEAMAAAKPVIATAVDGNVEQVADGETGLLVPPADAQALAAAILALAQDPDRAARMGVRGRERVEREFSLERMTGAFLSLYERLLSERGGPVEG